MMNFSDPFLVGLLNTLVCCFMTHMQALHMQKDWTMSFANEDDKSNACRIWEFCFPYFNTKIQGYFDKVAISRALP